MLFVLVENMNKEKEYNIKRSREILTDHRIKWESFNNDYHWKIGKIDYFPSTLKWISGEDRGIGIEELLKYIQDIPRIEKNHICLSVEEIFNIAKKVKPLNLEKVCEAIHKAVYKGEKV